MPHVAILCEFGTVSGGERSILAALPLLQENGWSATAVTPGSGELAGCFRRCGVEVLSWMPRDAEGSLLEESARHELLRSLLRRGRFDLVHANSLSMAKLSGPVVGQMQLPSIGHLRDIIRVSRRGVERLNLHTRLLAVSDATRAYHLAQGVDASRCVVQHNGVDLEQFQPRPPTGGLHRELGLEPSARLIGAIGQIGLRKGLDTLLQAFSRVASETVDTHCVLVGARWSDKGESRRYEEHLRLRSEQPPLAGRVHWLGYRGDVPRLMNEWTVLAHAARQEPLGRVLLEAAASGAAVIATDVGGAREIFPDTQIARLVPVDKPRALADHLLQVLRDPRLRRRLGKAARRRAEDAFDIRNAAAGLLDHYGDVVSRQHD